MKSILISLLFISASSATTVRDLQIESKKHFDEKDYFTALDTIAQNYKYVTPDQNIQHYIEGIVLQTGTYYFNTYSDLELRKLNIPTTDLIMAKRNLYLKKFKYVHKRLSRMPKGHRLLPESLLVKASAHYMAKEQEAAVKTYTSCITSAKDWLDRTEGKKFKYFSMIRDTCALNIARIYFGKGLYKKSIKFYEKIPKDSFKWPYTLLERSWAYYYLGNYNRSLGILITYNSPLLQSYFTPEAEYLKALNYYKLCLYNDALLVINKYYESYKPKSLKLKALIQSKQNSKPFYYYKLMFTPISESEKDSHFLRNLITQMSKRLKYNLDLNSLKGIMKEIKRSNKTANIKLLRRMKRDLQQQINHYVKVSIYQFINSIHKESANLFDLKLEILSNQRTMAYKNSSFNKNRKRGDLKNIKKRKNQDIWTFQNSFWADELGEYSFALSSTCKTRKI